MDLLSLLEYVLHHIVEAAILLFEFIGVGIIILPESGDFICI